MKHVFFCGLSGVGKSFAIQRALSDCNIEPKGFCTRKAGDGCVYLGPAGAPPPEDDEHLVACVSVRPPVVDPARFDALGTALLSDILPGDVVLMDEIGYLERDASAFSARILELIGRNDIRIIGVCRADRDTPLLCGLRSHENVELHSITPASREAAYAQALAFLRGEA